MPEKRGKFKPNAAERCYGRFLDWDMFGEHITFNLHGREKYNTCGGVICTILIVLITGVFGWLAVLKSQTEHEVPTLLKLSKPDFFEPGRDYQVR